MLDVEKLDIQCNQLLLLFNVTSAINPQIKINMINTGKNGTNLPLFIDMNAFLEK